VLSRLLFALSFDRVLPTAVSNVRAKSHAPMTAAAIVTVLLFGFTLLIVYTSILQITRNFTLIAAGIFSISSFAAAILPWRRRDLYAQSPKVLGNRILGLPAITVIGGLSCIYWLVGLYLGATKAQVSGGYDTTSVITLVGTCLIGAVAYVISRIALARKGLNLDLALHELPPE
jgi:amino acid transporter